MTMIFVSFKTFLTGLSMTMIFVNIENFNFSLFRNNLLFKSLQIYTFYFWLLLFCFGLTKLIYIKIDHCNM
jgi:hypothetical protein